MVTLLFGIWYKGITENFQTNINSNTSFIDWFNFPINDLFYQLSIRFKVDQIKKAISLGNYFHFDWKFWQVPLLLQMLSNVIQ